MGSFWCQWSGEHQEVGEDASDLELVTLKPAF